MTGFVYMRRTPMAKLERAEDLKKAINKINDLTNAPIKSIEIYSSNLKHLDQVKKIISLPGETDVTLKINNNNVDHHYKLSEKRKIDQNTILHLKKAGVTLKIY